MAFNHLAMPEYKVFNPVDTTPIYNALDSNQRLGQQQRQFDAQNKLAQAHLGLAQNQDRRQQAQFDTQQQLATVQKFAGHAQNIMQMTDPTQRTQAWHRLIASHPKSSDLPLEYWDPQRGPQMLIQEAQGYLGPKDQADINYKRAMAAKAQAEAASGGETPSNIREWQAFQRMTPEQQQQYLTMKRAQPWLNQGTQFSQPNPVNPAAPPVASLPIDVSGKAAAQETGKARGQATVDLPGVERNAALILGYIDKVIKDPNLSSVTGWQGYLPTYRSSSQDTEERIKQLQGGAFLQAYQDLKGGGQITEIEGAKAERAKARLLNLTQSDAGYLEALNDFRKEVISLTELARRKARGGGAAPASGPAADPLGIR